MKVNQSSPLVLEFQIQIFKRHLMKFDRKTGSDIVEDEDVTRHRNLKD